MEDLTDENDAYERRDTMILSGTPIPVCSTNENVTEVVKKVVHDLLNADVDASDISSAHRLGKIRPGNSPDNRPIIVKLCRRSKKKELLSKCRQAQQNIPPKNRLFINDSLTPKRRAIAFAIRKMKQFDNSLVTGCTSIDGNIYAFTKSPMAGGRDKKHLVNTYEKLQQFCTEFVQKPIDFFLSEWKF